MRRREGRAGREEVGPMMMGHERVLISQSHHFFLCHLVCYYDDEPKIKYSKFLK